MSQGRQADIQNGRITSFELFRFLFCFLKKRPTNAWLATLTEKMIQATKIKNEMKDAVTNVTEMKRTTWE